MPRQKKDAQPISMKMDSTLYDQLQQYCAETGLSKTAAIERSLKRTLDDWFAIPEDQRKERI